MASLLASHSILANFGKKIDRALAAEQVAADSSSATGSTRTSTAASSALVPFSLLFSGTLRGTALALLAPLNHRTLSVAVPPFCVTFSFCFL
jgi:hypothetical protein